MRVMETKVTSIRLGEGEFTHPVIVVGRLPVEALLGMDLFSKMAASWIQWQGQVGSGVSQA